MADSKPHPITPHSYLRLRSPRRDDTRPGCADFNPNAWVSILEEQRLAIARAAGVDPSKVRIQIGH